MINNNFKWLVEYSHTGYSDCSNYGCDEEGICRCYTIEDAHVTTIDLNDIVKKTIEQLSPTGISKKRNDRLNLIFPNDDILDQYGIYRLSVIHKLWSPSLYEVEVEGGYYGQEIGDIILDKEIFEKWSEDCITFWSIDNITDKINFLLEREYGRVLPYLSNLTPRLVTISFDEIDWKSVNQTHLKNVKNEDCPYYVDEYTLPKGIVRKVSDKKYQIIDGYHRILKTGEKTFEVYSFE